MKYLIFLLAVNLVFGCVKEYSVPGMKYDDILVIDGMLIDNNTATVKISRTFNTIQKNPEVVSGAEVYITDSDGKVLKLSEDLNDAGTYRADPEEIDVQVGKSYQLTVKQNGNTYTSSDETMNAAPDVENLGFVKSAQNDGVWVVASTTGQDDGTRYFAWSYEETWKSITPFVSTRPIHKSVCFVNNKSVGIFFSNTAALSKNQLKNEKVYFIDFMNQRLSARYSTMINVYSISRDSYTYLEHIRKINNDNGGIFDPIPSSMNGNLICSDASVPVIGNFQVSASLQKRLYIDRSELGPNIVVGLGMKRCQLDCLGLSPQLDSMIKANWYIMDTVSNCGVRISNFTDCFDCLSTGASDIAPAWWVERNFVVK